MDFVTTDNDLALLLFDMAVTVAGFMVFFVARATLERTTRTSPTSIILLSQTVAALVAALAGGLLAGGFAAARALWTIATVSTPLVCLTVFIRNRKPFYVIVAGLLVLLKVYGEVVEPSRLEVRRFTVPVAGLQGRIRIAHLSDLHWERLRTPYLDAREAANSFHPHLVFWTGDLTGRAVCDGGLRTYLAGFRTEHGSYLVTGNLERWRDPRLALAGANVRVLSNESVLVGIGPDLVGIAGLSFRSSMNPRLAEALAHQIQQAQVRILLSHVPDTLGIARTLPYQLLFCGHTHGGQVCVPFVGPLVTLSRVPHRIAAGGLHRVDGLTVVVSRGLGMEPGMAPRVRLSCRPDIVLVELVPVKKAPVPAE